VSAIVARWGLPDGAHFNRAFKAAYGLPPARYRAVYGLSSEVRDVRR
jgi:AraC-like DNA-binding protein